MKRAFTRDPSSPLDFTADVVAVVEDAVKVLEGYDGVREPSGEACDSCSSPADGLPGVDWSPTFLDVLQHRLQPRDCADQVLRAQCCYC